MAFIDYYKIMGIKKDFPQNEMREAYKRRAKQFHPDLHPNDPKAKVKFQALNEAYEVLHDPKKREQYDKYGENWKNADLYEQQQQTWNQGGQRTYRGGSSDFDPFSDVDGSFSSIFDNLFAHGARSQRRSNQNTDFYSDSVPNSDVQAKVTIDMYTAILGGEIMIQSRNEKLRLKVKPGTQSGTKVKLNGKGNQNPDGSFGNLVLTFQVNLPTNLSERQKQLLRQMQQSS